MRDSDAEARRWLRQAENDFAFGELALREGFFAQACFIAQQTAEKALKSVAYGRGRERVVLGQSIAELVGRLLAASPELSKLRGQAGLLDQYYVATPSYPNGLPGGVPFEAFAERQAREAIQAARAFLEVARRMRSAGRERTCRTLARDRHRHRGGPAQIAVVTGSDTRPW